MSWNYRIIQYADGDGFGLHEVYYDRNWEVTAWTEEAIVVGDTVKEINDSLLRMRVDAKNRPVFIEAEWEARQASNHDLDHQASNGPEPGSK